MKNERTADKVINGMVHIYSDEFKTFLPQYIDENGLKYALHRDTMTYLPLLEVDEPCEIGMWGRKRLEYLRTEKKGTYTALMISGLIKHLAEIDKATNDMENKLTEEICKAEGVTEALKKSNQMEWVARRNNIKNRVREIIYNELIYI